MSNENLGSFMQAVGDTRHKRAERLSNGTLLSPAGKPGPIYAEITKNTLVKVDGKLTATTQAREFFDDSLSGHITDLYNSMHSTVPMVTQKGAEYTHALFMKDVHSYFWQGLNLYLKSALRQEEKNAPKVEGSKRVRDTTTGRTITIKDERPQWWLTRDYIVAAYAEKYGEGVVSTETTNNKPLHEPALDAFLSEKVRLYALDFFSILKESMNHGVDIDKSFLMAQRAYAHSPTIYKEMGVPPYNLDAQTVADVATSKPLQAHERFEAYANLYENLKTVYVDEDSFLTENELRTEIFNHPHTVEAGLQIASDKIDVLLDDEHYHMIPKKAIIKICIANPNDYIAELDAIKQNAETLLDAFACSSDMCSDLPEEGAESLLRHYKLDKDIYRLLIHTSVDKVHKQIEKAINNFNEVIDKMNNNGGTYRWKSRYRIFRRFVITDKKGNISKILQYEAARAQEQEAYYESLIEKGEMRDDVWGEYYAYFGYDDEYDKVQTDGKKRRIDSIQNEIIDLGEILISELREEWGDDDVETFLDKQIDTLSDYINQGFPTTDPEIGNLKYALLWSPENVIDEYNNVSGTPWPSTVTEIEYIPR